MTKQIEVVEVKYLRNCCNEAAGDLELLAISLHGEQLARPLLYRCKHCRDFWLEERFLNVNEMDTRLIRVS